MSKKLTNKIVDERLSGRNILRLEDYADAKTIMKWKCLKEDCNHEWPSTFNSINAGHGCPKCYGNIKHTPEEVDLILKTLNILRLSKYVSYNMNMSCKCLIDGYEWPCSLSNLLNKTKINTCPRCSGYARITNEIIDERLVGRNIIRIDNYVDVGTTIKFKCQLDNRVWESTVNNIFNGQGCPACSGKEKLNNDIVDERIKGRKLLRISDYINNEEHITWKCLKDGCNHEFPASFGNISNGRGCPICRNKNEHRVFEYLCSKYGESNVERQHKIIIKNRKYYIDFVVNGVFIEYNGEQHYKPVKHWGGQQALEKQILRDKELRNYCLETNINLIEIPHWLSHDDQYNLLDF